MEGKKHSNSKPHVVPVLGKIITIRHSSEVSLLFQVFRTNFYEADVFSAQFRLTFLTVLLDHLAAFLPFSRRIFRPHNENKTPENRGLVRHVSAIGAFEIN